MSEKLTKALYKQMLRDQSCIDWDLIEARYKENAKRKKHDKQEEKK